MLKQYRLKRDFSKTPEPEGPANPSESVLRFVVQKHSATHLHYDFRLECEGVLKSWAVPKGPSLDPGVKRLAIAVEDHPTSYIDFEGVIPKGQYGGGEVIVWDRGVYAPAGEFAESRDLDAAVTKGIKEGKLTFHLFGQKLKGEWALVHMHDSQWLLIKANDEFTSDLDVTQQDESVLTGRDNDELRDRSTMPTSISPMLAIEADTPFTDAAWSFEPKLDGIRAIAYVSDSRVELLSRAGNDLLPQFPKISSGLKAIDARTLIVDGEIVAMGDDGSPNFQRLMRKNRVGAKIDEVQFWLFDLIYRDGEDFRMLPFRIRRAALENLRLGAGPIRRIDSFPEIGELLFEQAIEHGFEGIVGKRLDSTYHPGGRNGDWVKVKRRHSEEFQVVGFTNGEGARMETFGALLLAQRKDGGLRYCGNVGSGFSDEDLAEIRNQLDRLQTLTPPIDIVELPKPIANLHWVEPELVAEIKFASWTNDHRLRMPVFLRLRSNFEVSEMPTKQRRVLSHEPSIEDLKDRVRSSKHDFDLSVDGSQIQLTHLDKILWPAHASQRAVLKRDLIEYFLQISPFLLPQIKDRPLSFVRFPDGIAGKSFFQRRSEKNRPEFVETTEVWSDHNEGTAPYVMCNNLATLVWLGQLAALEIHPWYSRIDNQPDAEGLSTDFRSEKSLENSVLNFPDFVVFDLDPNIPVEDPEHLSQGWHHTVDVALGLKRLLDGLRLKSFVKTSGKTGLHVFVPIQRIYAYDATRKMAEIIGWHLEREIPELVTMEWSVKKRPEKVFFDHNQNVRGKTLAAIYSPRPVPGAPVSFPVSWTDLTAIHPSQFNIESAMSLIDKHATLWNDILDAKIALPESSELTQDMAR